MSAEQEGLNLLQKFRDEKLSKSRDLNTSTSFNHFEDSGYFEAVTDGSRVALAYSETKKKESRSHMSGFDLDETASETSPLDLVRAALMKLNDLGDDSVPEVSTLLQGVEEYLEKASSARSRVQSRLAYSAEKTRRGAGQRADFFDDDSRLEHEGPHSPVLADRSGLGHLSVSAAQAQRSVFMENQLDLNESEMEYYEGIINDLADQLEAAHAEKEALQDSLGRLEQQREEGLQLSQKELDDVRSAFQRMLDDLQTQLAQANEAHQREVTRSGALQREIDHFGEIQGRSSQVVQQLQAVEQQHKERIQQLEELVEEERATNLRLQLSAAEASAPRAAVTDRSDSDEADDLRSQVDELQAELEDNRAEIDHLVSIIEDLRGKLDSTLDGQEAAPTGGSRDQDQEAVVEGLRAEIEALKSALQARDADLAEQAQTAESLRAEQLLFGPASPAATPPPKGVQQQQQREEREEMVVVESHSSFSRTTTTAFSSDVSFRLEEIDRDRNRIVFTPVRSGGEGGEVSSLAHGPRSLLKVYMDNQLDLNESEMQYYEGVVNGLAEKVEELAAEKEALQAEHDALVDASEASERAVEELQRELGARREELGYVNELFEGVTRRLEEREAEVRALTDRLSAANTAQTGTAADDAPQGEAPATSTEPDRVSLTNSFLGIEGGAADSDAEDFFEGRRPQTEVEADSPLGPHAADASFLSSGLAAADASLLDVSQRGGDDVEDLRRRLARREQQVKVQISQLQALQDALSDQKSANNALKQQRAGFKAAVETAKRATEELAAKELQALDRARDLEAQLLAEAAAHQEQQRGMEQAQRQTVELQAMVEDLRVQMAAYRLQIEQHRVQQDFNKSFVESTPTRPPRPAIADGSDSTPQSANQSFNSATPLKARLTRTEAQVDDLMLQLRVATKAREETQLELEKAVLRLQAKTRQCEDASRDCAALQEELDGRLEELDRLKLQEMKTDAAHRARLMDCEGEAELLRERLQVLEAAVADLTDALAGETADLQAERDENASLRDMLAGVRERDDSMGEIVAELRAEHDKLAAQLSEAGAELQSKTTQLAASERACADLRQQIADVEEDGEARERDYEERRRSLEAEAQSVRESMESFSEDSAAHLHSLKVRLEAAARDQAELETEVQARHEEVHRLERDLAARALEVVRAERAVTDVAESVQYHQSRLDQLGSSLLDVVASRMTSMDERLSAAAHAVQAVVSRSCVLSRDSALSREMVEQALRESQAALRKALQRHEDDAAEKEDLWQQAQAARREVETLTASVDDAKRQLSERDAQNRALAAETVISPEEYARLAERLSEAEARAVQMSTEGAKAFARSAKSVAYLEGECSRLQTLVDHFRVVNAKLGGDLRLAHEEGVQSKSLEHRMKIAARDEAALRDRLGALEAQLARKDRELLDSLQAAREQEETRAAHFESELNKAGDQLRIAQERGAALNKDYEELQLAFEESEQALRKEVHSATDRLRLAEKEAASRAARSEDAEFEMRQLRTLLSEREHQISQTEVRISLLLQEAQITRETQQSSISDLTAEVSEKQGRVQQLEGTLSSLRLRVADLEAGFNQRDEEMSQKLLLRAETDEENRELRAANEALGEEVTALTLRNEELVYRASELVRQQEALQQEYSALKNDTLRSTAERLKAAEDSLGRTSGELESTRRGLAQCKEALVSARESVDANESALQDLRAENIKLGASEQLMGAANESLSEENEFLRGQVDELHARVADYSGQVSAMRAQLNDQADAIAELEAQAADHEAKLRGSRARIAAADDSEATIAAEIRAFCEALNIGPAGNHSTSTTQVTTTTSTSSTSTSRFSIGKDLFASPPLTVGRSAASQFTHDSMHGGEGTPRTGGDSASQVKQSFDALRAKTEALVGAYNALHAESGRARKEQEGLRKSHDKVVDRMQLLISERDGLQSRLQTSESDLHEARAERSAAEHERDLLLSAQESTAQRTGAILRDLDSTLLEALSRANDAAAGVVPIQTNALSDLSISQHVIRSDDATASRRSADAVVALLSTSVGEVDRATAYLLGVVTALVAEYRAKRASAEKLEGALAAKEAAWLKDRAAFLESIASAEEETAIVEGKHSRALVEAETCRLDLERVQQRLADLARNNGDLEAEFKASSEVIAELRGALSEAESLCVDLRGRQRALQSDLDRKIDEVAAVSEQLAAVRRRATDAELAHEKTTALLGRVRAEKEALDNVRRSLESELDRSRGEVAALREAAQGREDGHGATFEMEKLLAALGTTLDQLLPQAQQSKSAVVAAPSNADAQAADPSLLTTRVDDAVRRLAQLRSQARDDARSRRLLQSQYDSLVQEAASVQASSDDAHRQLKRALASAAEREGEVRDKVRETAEAVQEVQQLREEVLRLKKESDAAVAALEAERKGQQKHLTDLQMRNSEVTRLQIELGGRSAVVSKLQAQASALEERLREAHAESDYRAEQLRAAKANSERIMATIEQLERGAENDKREREAAERKLLETESMSATIARLKARISELESQAAKSAEDGRLAAQARAGLEEQHQRTVHELETCRKKAASLESRIEAIHAERTSFSDEVAETRRKIAVAKEHAEREREQRIKSEAAIEAMRRLGDEGRRTYAYADEFSARTQEMELRALQAEEEKRSLRQKVAELRAACEARDNQSAQEAADRAKLEKDLKQLRSALTKRTQELSASANHSSLLRTEGRNARKTVLEAVQHIREIVNIVRIDAQTAGVEIRSPEPKSKQRRTSPDEQSPAEEGGGGLGEALALNELLESLEALRSAIVFVRSAPKNRGELDKAVRRLEADNASLRRDLQAAEAKRSELVTHYKRELHTMQLQVTEVRRTDGKNPHLAHQIAALEVSLKEERERRERAAKENDQLRTQLEQFGAGLSVPHRSAPGSYQAEIDTLRREMDKQKAAFHQLAQELNAVTHHRTVLRDTVEQLDRQLRLKIDSHSTLAGASSASHASSAAGDTGAEDEDALRRQVARYKARAAAIDELASTYRVSVMALYADGASYGAAQYGWQAHGVPAELSGARGTGRGVHLIGVGWIERELGTVRRSFEEELRLLDSEVGELRAKLRQSHSYVSELRRRFEESMKSIYRAGRGGESGGMQQLDVLRVALDAAEEQMAGLQNELAAERTGGRHRHAQLLDEVTRALQMRDAALSALHRLEQLCAERGLDTEGFAVYEALKAEVVTPTLPVGGVRADSSVSDQHQHRQAVSALVRGLVASDHDLAEMERRERRRLRETSSTAASSAYLAQGDSLRARAPAAAAAAAAAAGDDRGSPSQLDARQQQYSRSSTVRVEERLTESFLTNRGAVSEQHHHALHTSHSSSASHHSARPSSAGPVMAASRRPSYGEEHLPPRNSAPLASGSLRVSRASTPGGCGGGGGLNTSSSSSRAGAAPR